MSNTADDRPIQTSQIATPEAIRAWILEYLEVLLQMPASEISTSDPLAAYGMDSSGAVGMAGDINAWLHLNLEPDILYMHPSVDSLVTFLSEKVAQP